MDQNEKFIFMGGGGFAIELYEYMLADNVPVQGYYALEENPELSQYIPWLGNSDEMKKEDFDHTAKYILAVRLIKYRRKIIEFMRENDLEPGSFVSSWAYYSKIADIGPGAVIFPNAMVTGNPKVGEFLFMDAFSVISHGDIMGDNIVLGPGVIVTGDSEIGDDVTFGVNSAILPGTTIGSHVEIAINSYPPRRVKEYSSIITPPGKNFGSTFNRNFN